MAYFEDEIKTSGNSRRRRGEIDDSLDISYNNQEDDESMGCIEDVNGSYDKEKEDNFLDLEDL